MLDLDFLRARIVKIWPQIGAIILGFVDYSMHIQQLSGESYD